MKRGVPGERARTWQCGAGTCQPCANARLLLQLQIKHAVTEAEIQQLKRKVSGCPGSLRVGGTPPPSPRAPPWISISPIPS